MSEDSGATRGDVRFPFKRPAKGEGAGVLELDDVGGVVEL